MSGSGVEPVQRTSRHLKQINSDVAKVIAIANESMLYMG